MKAEIWYLFNSGFAIKTAQHFFIFDYYPFGHQQAAEGLSSGFINPEEIKELDVTVFASHRHPDHFSKEIFAWRQTIPHLRYVLSDDIKIPAPLHGEDILAVHPGREYIINDVFSLRTLRSTDKGVAFVLKADGLSLYHAGDLNWWHWNGEPLHWNNTMGANYRKQIDLVSGERFDLAFIPMDPRLEENYLLGMDYFLKQTDTIHVFPMHFGEDFSVFDRLKEDERAMPYRDRIHIITHRGEKFTLE